MIDFHIGKVATRNIAMNFAQECVKSINPLGGHNFYLANDYEPSKINLGLIKRTNVVGFYSPYEFTLGGGEKYLSDIMKFFIENNYQIVFYNNTTRSNIHNTLRLFDINPDNIIIGKIESLRTLCNIKNYYFDYFIEMSNQIVPRLKDYIPDINNNHIAYKHIFHCQFPENIIEHKLYIPDLVKATSYVDIVIANSDFTVKYLNPFYKNKLKVLNPYCEHSNNSNNICKEHNSFITIGRLFPYVSNANNKNIDKIIDTFIKLKSFNFKLNIVCSVKDETYFKKLKNIVNLNGLSEKIIFYPDISNKLKYKLLNESKYYVHATGIVCPKGLLPHEEEHFGISIIEGLLSSCLPITADRGYPPYYIENGKNGYLFNNQNELFNILYKIVNSIELPIMSNAMEYNVELCKQFSSKQKYNETIFKLLCNF
jgi:glycosyltransferase involved in cell wall biosynthesis